ncbi:DUF167 domain-containing protein [Antarcticimicrobium sediminis]|uniref:DUF167 domain-containing protein n=1 Tax=Antarcticimicrobium sediminis TaxID=2546227 RepID=A0A4V2Z7I8_9RHOB|nr:DUF167 domain-containing protein [Antarcticimicrobium sediminis]TDE36686.1 DUF167 domain-containing protein [Antarcticimicrobium sediminis]
MAKPKIRDLPDLSDLAQPGTEIALRVTPKASRLSLTRDGDGLRATVTVVPENGKANAAVQALLAAAMGVAPSRLELRRGQTARDKVFVYVG